MGNNIGGTVAQNLAVETDNFAVRMTGREEGRASLPEDIGPSASAPEEQQKLRNPPLVARSFRGSCRPDLGTQE